MYWLKARDYAAKLNVDNWIQCLMLSCCQNCYVAAVWLDTRTAETVAEILTKTPGNDQDHLRVI